MERVPGAAEEPAGIGPGQGVDPGALGVGEADGRDIHGAGQSCDGGDGIGSGVNAQVSGGNGGFPPVFPLARKPRKKMIRIMARAVRSVCRFCALQAVTWDWSQPKPSLEVVTHCGASTGFRPRSSLRIRGIRWLAGGCR
jgi:hypothetical protein